MDNLEFDQLPLPAKEVKVKKRSCTAHPLMVRLRAVYESSPRWGGVNMSVKLSYSAQGRFADSSLLQKQVIDVITTSIPKEYRRGGSQTTVGGTVTTKTGKKIRVQNKAQKGTPDVIYDFTFANSFKAEIKIKDTLRKEQKEYINFSAYNKDYCCVIHNMDEFFTHWAKYCEMYYKQFPERAIYYLNDEFIEV